MLEIKKNYLLTLSESQASELYSLLRREKDIGQLTSDNELVLVLHELSPIFSGGFR
jgi:hypothetical protein